TEQTHYPLTLFAVATDTVEFKLIYNTQQFSHQTILQILGHLRTALTEMVTHPQQSVNHLSILSEEERGQLLSFGLGPTVGSAQLPVQVAIAQQATSTPQATALIFEGQSLTYAQLNNQANQLARYLQQRISPGELVGLCVERSVDMIVSLLAILKAGCAYVPLDPSYPIARLQYTLEHAGVGEVICHKTTQHLFSGTAFVKEHGFEILNLDDAREVIETQPISSPTTAAQSDTPAYVIYTSGSTGNPKGVSITHQNLSNLLSSMATRLRIQPSDTLMAVTTLAFDIAGLELFLPLISGAKLLLASQEVTRNSHQLIAYLDTFGVDIMQATPATWRLLLGSGWAGQSGLRILCGGEALEVDLARRLLDCAEEVWNVYGPTETTIWSGALELSAEILKKGTVPIGGPIDNTQFHVLDSQQQPVPVGVSGELYISGMGVSPGYWQQSELTAERFVQVPNLTDKRLYRTGDRVRYRADGLLDYLGRLDYQTKLRGYRIELGEIEAALMSHPKVTQAVVLINGETDADKFLAAYVTLVTATDVLSSSKMRSHLIARLPHYMVPAIYQVLTDFPLTPNGKINRLALAQMASSPAANDLSNRPKTPVETTLSTIWQSLLPQETISIYDNFFEIGGHSLLLVNAQSQIREQLSLELTLVDLFRYPTLSSLAAHISQRLEQGNSSVENNAQVRTMAIASGKHRLKQRLKQKKSAQQSSTKKLGGVS
ncbi:MAG: amino acid adenylation domain-containing protein, partial [Cyanobacteria bacterium J06607_10]